MNKFLLKLIALGVLVVLAAYAICAARSAFWLHASKEMNVPSGARVLCVGSSQIGCSFVQLPGWFLLWRPSIPIQYAWMRLDYLDRNGLLDGVKVVLTDFNYATIGVQQDANLERYWIEMLPISWNQTEKIPLSSVELYIKLITHVTDAYEVSSLGERIDPRITLVDRKAQWLEEQWNRNRKNHDAQDVALNPRWKSSIERALIGMKNICKKHHIRFLVVMPPVSSFYRSKLSHRTQERLIEMKRFMQSEDMEIVDASKIMQDDAFVDLVHLSPTGAKQFSSWFVKSVGVK